MIKYLKAPGVEIVVYLFINNSPLINLTFFEWLIFLYIFLKKGMSDTCSIETFPQTTWTTT